MDKANAGRLLPTGGRSEVLMMRDDSERLSKQANAPIGIPRNGSITRVPSEMNAVRSQHIGSGLNDNCFVSFTRSFERARRYATMDYVEGERSGGVVYAVDEALFEAHGVSAHALPDPYFPGEEEVSLRAVDCGPLPSGIVVDRIRVTPDD
ncbi:hypothetical protein K6W76_30300 [Burkholderia anthina]|nr:hypothetical protein [Burkholderia anthina]MBY4870739.1 hypothetical protein [Burkholderia anthina]